jgi:hypothetical protein
MSDALTDISKETKAKMEWKAAIMFFVNRIDKQTRIYVDREEWEENVDELIETITEEIYEELELKWVTR